MKKKNCLSIFWSRGIKKVKKKEYQYWYKRTFDFRPELKIENIFDYNRIMMERLPKEKEVYHGNMMYGLGKVFRDYSGYTGKIYCASEHGTPTERFDNTMEYRDNDMPIVLLHSSERRDFLKDKTDKLMIPYGPNFAAYGKPLYTDFAIQATRKSLGKTLLVYPQHNNDVSEFVDFEKQHERLISYVQDIKDKGCFQTVIVSLYYIDIERGLHKFYEDKGWIVVSSGKNISYDFPDCFLTILGLADFVIAQSITGIAFSVYKKIPSIYFPGNRKMIQEDGTFYSDAWTIDGKSWIEQTETELIKLFSKYRDTLSEKQYQWCERMWGYNEVKTPEELYMIFDFAKAIRHKRNNIKNIKRESEKSKYVIIKKYLDEAIRIKEGK